MATQNDDPESTPVPEGDHEPDAQSDPALDDGESSDWSSEGGAVPEGPATDPDDS